MHYRTTTTTIIIHIIVVVAGRGCGPPVFIHADTHALTTTQLSLLVLSSSQAVDAAFCDEVRRRAEVMVASASATRLDTLRSDGTKWHGVELLPSKEPGGIPKYVSRTFLDDHRKALGTYEYPLEAAVAYDYGNTYMRGSKANNLNFAKGSPADCRVAPGVCVRA